jgi:hypothetical protein
MLWWVGSGLLLVWLILLIVHPSGWIHLLLLSGLSLFVIQTAAYRKTRATLKNRK